MMTQRMMFATDEEKCTDPTHVPRTPKPISYEGMGYHGIRESAASIAEQASQSLLVSQILTEPK